MEKGSQGKKTGSIGIFEEGMRNKVRCDCQRHISKLVEKSIYCHENKHLSNSEKGGNS